LKRTAFEKDSNSFVAELFLQVRDFIKICIGNSVKEKHNEYTTSFYAKEGGVCSIKVSGESIYLNWFRGSSIEDKYNKLEGDTKVSRVQYVYTLDKLTRDMIRYYVDQTFIFLIEYNELKKIKKEKICSKKTAL